MKEVLEVYDLNSKLLGIKARSEFQDEINKEFKETGKITQKVKSIRLLLLNSDGRIYLQKRSNSKEENAGLYDKTVGGHVLAGQTWDITLVKESAEELGFPIALVSSQDFKEAIKNTDLSVIGLANVLEYNENFLSTRIKKDGSKIIQPSMTTIYIGYYDGAIRFKDGEASGIEVFSLDELKQEISTKPEKFTEDLKFMIQKYESVIKSIDKSKV